MAYELWRGDDNGDLSLVTTTPTRDESVFLTAEILEKIRKSAFCVMIDTDTDAIVMQSGRVPEDFSPSRRRYDIVTRFTVDPTAAGGTAIAVGEVVEIDRLAVRRTADNRVEFIFTHLTE